MHATLSHTDELFAWTDERIVLFVERDGDGWVIARGWRQADRLTDIRRWRFACERRLVGQMRRLVRERIDDEGVANITADSLAGWLTAPVPSA